MEERGYLLVDTKFGLVDLFRELLGDKIIHVVVLLVLVRRGRQVETGTWRGNERRSAIGELPRKK